MLSYYTEQAQLVPTLSNADTRNSRLSNYIPSHPSDATDYNSNTSPLINPSRAPPSQAQPVPLSDQSSQEQPVPLSDQSSQEQPVPLSDQSSQEQPVLLSDQASHIDGYGLYLIYSNWALNDVKKFIKDIFTDIDEKLFDKLVGPIRIDYVRGEESEKTLALLHYSIYNRLFREGFDKKMFAYDFRIQPYEIRENNKPDIGYSSNLYIPLPTALDKESCRSDLLSKLKVLEKYNILTPRQYKLTLPVVSRRTGESTRSAFVEFSPVVKLRCRAIARIMLNDTDWNTDSLPPSIDKHYRVKCLWAADRQSRRRSRCNSITMKSNFYSQHPVGPATSINSKSLLTEPRSSRPLTEVRMSETSRPAQLVRMSETSRRLRNYSEAKETSRFYSDPSSYPKDQCSKAGRGYFYTPSRFGPSDRDRGHNFYSSSKRNKNTKNSNFGNRYHNLIV